MNIYFNNNAPVVNADNINRSSTGGSWATPLDPGSYGIGLYINSSFGSGAAIADHIQWSVGGIDNTSADERSDEAESGGIWDDQSTWVATSPTTRQIHLTDGSGAELHGSDDYLVLPDFQITSIVRSSATNQVTLTWPMVNNLEVIVESTSDLSLNDWPDATTTNSNSAVLSGQTANRAFYRLLYSLP